MFNKYDDLVVYLKDGDTARFDWTDYTDYKIENKCLIVRHNYDVVAIFNMETVLKVVRE